MQEIDHARALMILMRMVRAEDIEEVVVTVADRVEEDKEEDKWVTRGHHYFDIEEWKTAFPSAKIRPLMSSEISRDESKCCHQGHTHIKI